MAEAGQDQPSPLGPVFGGENFSPPAVWTITLTWAKQETVSHNTRNIALLKADCFAENEVNKQILCLVTYTTLKVRYVGC